MTTTSSSIFCSIHPTRIIESIDDTPSAEKSLYCLECFLEQKDGYLLFKKCPTVSNFMNNIASFFQETKEKIFNPKEIPYKYSKKLETKAEKLNQFSENIIKQKDIVNAFFQELTQFIVKELEMKKFQCLDFLEEQILQLENNYQSFEAQLNEAYPSPEDLEKRLPSILDLEKKLTKIKNSSELEKFVNDLKEKSKENEEASGILFQSQEIKRTYFNKFTKKLLKEENKLPFVQFKFLGIKEAKLEIKPKLDEFLEDFFSIEQKMDPNVFTFHGVEKEEISPDSVDMKKILPRNYRVPPKLCTHEVRMP